MLAFLLAGVLAAEPAPFPAAEPELPAWVEGYVDRCIAAKPALIADLKRVLRTIVDKQTRRDLAKLIKEAQRPEILARVPLTVLQGKPPTIGDVGALEIHCQPYWDLVDTAHGKVVQVIEGKHLIVEAYDQTIWLDCPVGTLTDGDEIILDTGLWQYVGTHTYTTALGTTNTVHRLARVEDRLAVDFHVARLAAAKKAKQEAAAARAKRSKKKPAPTAKD